jgi:signal transduction histidine kinase
VVALWVVLLTVGANVLLGGVLARQADGLLQARAEAAAATVRLGSDGAVEVVDVRDDAALDVGTWIFAADGSTVEAPPNSPAELDRLAAALAADGSGPRTTESGSPDRFRLLATPVDDGGLRIATVVTSTSLTPYRQVQRLAWIGSAALGLALLLIVHLVLRANVARALRPVREMTTQAGRWSSDDVDRRFGTAPRPAELDELARTLDAVLDRLAAVLRHERQLSDEISHELRTPLARIQGEIDLMRGHPGPGAAQIRALDALDDATASMSRILETLMAAARSATGRLPGRCLPAGVLSPLARERAGARPGLDISVGIPLELAAGVDAAVLERLVAPVLDNAVRHARRQVRVTGEELPGRIRLLIADDGPGITTDLRQRVFEPGWRGDVDDGHDGAGLGLALARRLAVAAGGDVRVTDGGPGACVVIDLPAG